MLCRGSHIVGFPYLFLACRLATPSHTRESLSGGDGSPLEERCPRHLRAHTICLSECLTESLPRWICSGITVAPGLDHNLVTVLIEPGHVPTRSPITRE